MEEKTANKSRDTATLSSVVQLLKYIYLWVLFEPWAGVWWATISINIFTCESYLSHGQESGEQPLEKRGIANPIKINW